MLALVSLSVSLLRRFRIKGFNMATIKQIPMGNAKKQEQCKNEGSGYLRWYLGVLGAVAGYELSPKGRISAALAGAGIGFALGSIGK